jgi:hypothetical protein
MSPEGYYNANIVSQAMGGHRTGTSLISQWSQMNGKMTPATAKAMENFGFLQPGEWKQAKGGGVIVEEATKQRLSEMVGTNPLDMAASLIEQFKAKGVTDKAEQARLIMGMFGRQTTQRLNADEVANFQNIIAERGRVMQGANGAQAFSTLMNKDVELNLKSMQSAWENLLYAVAGPQSETVIAMLKKVTDGLNSMTGAVRGMDPQTLSSVANGLGYLAFGLSAGGAAAILAALGPAGWLVGGLAALAAVAATMDGNLFGGITTKIVDALKAEMNGLSFSGAFAGVGTKIYEALKTEVMDEIKGFGRDLEKLGVTPHDPTQAPGKTGHPFKRMNFNPGQQTMTAQPIQISMNVDGRALGQAVSDQLLYLATHSSSAPSADGRSYPTGGDHNYSST